MIIFVLNLIKKCYQKCNIYVLFHVKSEQHGFDTQGGEPSGERTIIKKLWSDELSVRFPCPAYIPNTILYYFRDDIITAKLFGKP